MTKHNELNIETSCLNKAAAHEMIFVLRAHDIAAPAAIRAWCNARIQLGKNRPDDPTIREALYCADAMETQRAKGI